MKMEVIDVMQYVDNLELLAQFPIVRQFVALEFGI